MKSTLNYLAVLVICALVFVCVGAANAAIVATLANGDFETYTPDNPSTRPQLDYSVDGWGEHDYSTVSPKAQAVIFDWPGLVTVNQTAGYPTFTGNGALGLIVNGATANAQTSWIYQSLGTVESADLLKRYTLTGDAGMRALAAGDSGNVTVAFATGASDSSMGTALASHTATISSIDATTPVQFSPVLNATYTPTSGDMGQTLYAVVSVARVSGTNLGDDQYLIDNLSLSSSPIPEPGTLTLSLLGVAGLIGYAWRRGR